MLILKVGSIIMRRCVNHKKISISNLIKGVLILKIGGVWPLNDYVRKGVWPFKMVLSASLSFFFGQEIWLCLTRAVHGLTSKSHVVAISPTLLQWGGDICM